MRVVVFVTNLTQILTQGPSVTRVRAETGHDYFDPATERRQAKWPTKHAVVTHPFKRILKLGGAVKLK